MHAEVTANDAVMVTGSAGFIGGALVPRLRELGRHVVGLDRVAEPASDSLRIDLTTLTEDGFGPGEWPPTIIHLAAVSKEPGSPWRDYYANNAEATRLLCRAADKADVRNIVFTSSMMVFALYLGLSWRAARQHALAFEVPSP